MQAMESDGNCGLDGQLLEAEALGPMFGLRGPEREGGRLCELGVGGQGPCATSLPKRSSRLLASAIALKASHAGQAPTWRPLARREGGMRPLLPHPHRVALLQHGLVIFGARRIFPPRARGTKRAAEWTRNLFPSARSSGQVCFAGSGQVCFAGWIQRNGED